MKMNSVKSIESIRGFVSDDSGMGMDWFLEYFLELFGHSVECGTPEMIEHFLYCSKEPLPTLYSAYSEVYRRVEAGLKVRSLPSIQLTDRDLAKYFSTWCSDYQMFAILFAKWAGLSEDQIRPIKNRRKEKRCWDLLNWFLCHPESQQPPENIGDIRMLDDMPYEVWSDHTCYKACSKGGKLILEDGSALETF